MHPSETDPNVSREAIYTAIYAMPREELRTEIIRLLRQARRARKPRARSEDRRGQIPSMVSIHVRPPEIDERGVPGHWSAVSSRRTISTTSRSTSTSDRENR